jgi:hypothetical protein
LTTRIWACDPFKKVKGIYSVLTIQLLSIALATHHHGSHHPSYGGASSYDGTQLVAGDGAAAVHGIGAVPSCW